MVLADFPYADSTAAGNSVTAPGGGSAFVSLANSIPGVFKITASWELTGTAETASNNVKVKVNGVNYTTGLMSHSAIGRMTLVIDRVTLDGVNPVQLAATNAATAGAIYTGDIEISRYG